MLDDVLNMTAAAIDSRVDSKCIDTLPLAMSYVPFQKWRDLYSAEVGLERGTIFSELDKPFLGRRTIK